MPATSDPYEEECDDDEPAAKRSKLFEPSDLYIMALSCDPDGAIHGLKVGRSGNIPQRAANLTTSLPFTMLVLATFPGAGGVEDIVHSALAHVRNTGGRGREWFHAPLYTVIAAVGYAMQSQLNVNGGGSAPKTEQ